MDELPPQQLGKLHPSKRITFVHQTGDMEMAIAGQQQESASGTFTGVEARNFYEDLLNEPSTSDVKEEIFDDNEPVRQQRSQRRRNVEFPEFNESDRNAFLKAAQEGNQEALEKYLQKGMPIDIMDSFYWTALMIAASAGNETICRYLISSGANYNLVNSKDQSIFDILEETKNEQLADRLITFINEQEISSPTYVDVPEDIFCSVCQRRYEGSESNHLTSTVHIYNAGKRGTTHSGIIIPESNIGYKLLKKKGWTEEQGLGKSGEGHKFPVRTILKRNRKGLGLEKMKPKVTHFQANDKRAVQRERIETSKANWKREMKQKQAKEQKIARSFRSAFSYDDSVAEYLGL